MRVYRAGGQGVQWTWRGGQFGHQALAVILAAGGEDSGRAVVPAGLVRGLDGERNDVEDGDIPGQATETSRASMHRRDRFRAPLVEPGVVGTR